MTLLVTSISSSSLAGLQRDAATAWTKGADAVELRVDGYSESLSELAAWLRTQSSHTWILTCRGKEEGGASDLSNHERNDLVRDLAKGTAAFVDIEMAAWDGVSWPRLIFSEHHFEGLPQDWPDRIERVWHAYPSAIGKWAYLDEDINAGFSAMELMRKYGSRAVAICMGESGVWTRVLAKKFGAFAGYSCLTSESRTAPGQLSLDEMTCLYRWAGLNAETRVFGVIGDPVAQSLSPLLHNQWLAEAGLNAVYLPFRVRGSDSLRRFLDGCRARPWLDVGGFSVTHPHKSGAFRWIGAAADRTSESIGALNTLVFQPNGVRGYNTDCHAALDSLAAALGGSKRELRRRTVDVLGTGGAARSVLSGLRDHGCDLTLYARSEVVGKELAEQFGCRLCSWNDRIRRKGEILINCTSVGLWPAIEETPLAPDFLGGCSLVFDLIYNPLETKLMSEARRLGKAVLGGLDMFIRQAAVQFELWTGVVPNSASARPFLEAHLQVSQCGAAQRSAD